MSTADLTNWWRRRYRLQLRASLDTLARSQAAVIMLLILAKVAVRD